MKITRRDKAVAAVVAALHPVLPRAAKDAYLRWLDRVIEKRGGCGGCKRRAQLAKRRLT